MSTFVPIQLKVGDVVQVEGRQWRLDGVDVEVRTTNQPQSWWSMRWAPVTREPKHGEVWRVHDEYWLKTDRSECSWVLLFSRRGVVAGEATSGWIPNPEKEFFAPSPRQAFEKLQSGKS